MADRRKPLLLMDVDGVLNPFPDCPPGFREYALFPDIDEPVHLARVHGMWLTELGETFDIAWATGWGANANRLLGPFFDLPEYPVVALPQIPFAPLDKLPAVAAFVGDRAAAWVDDVVTQEAREWALARPAPTLLAEINPTEGLTRRTVDRLLAWPGEIELAE